MYKIISNSIDYGPSYIEQVYEYCYSNQRNITSTYPNRSPQQNKPGKCKITKPKYSTKRHAPYPQINTTQSSSQPTALTPVLDNLAYYLPPNTFNEDKAQKAIKNIETHKKGASINELERAKELITDYLNIKHHGYLSARGRAVNQFTLDKDIKSIYEKIKNQLSAINCRLRKKQNVEALEQRLETLIQQCKENEATIQELRLEVIRLQHEINQQNK